MKLNIACIKGDGIGPEIVTQAQKVLNRVAQCYGHEIVYTDVLMGGASIDACGVPLTDEAIAGSESFRCRTDGLHRRKYNNLSLV